MKISTFILYYTIFVIIYILAANVNALQLEKQKRIVIYGDSITDNQLYPLLLESFLRTRYPKTHNLFWDRGWGGDQAKNLKRFKRDCLSLNPDCVMINLGMNDAGYTPEIGKRIEFFVENIEKMVKLAKKSNPDIEIVLISPVMYECQVQKNRYFYPYVLWRYSQRLAEVARELNVKYIDMNTLYTQSTGLLLRLFPDSTVFSRDGIHPNKIGQSIIAVNILCALGHYPRLADIIIDMNSKKIIKSEGVSAKIIKNKSVELEFERSLKRLPMPFIKDFQKFAPFVKLKEINSDILTIKGMRKGFYSLESKTGIIGTFTADEFEKGINIGELFNSPDYKHAEKVLETVREKQDIQYFLWRKIMTAKDGLFPRGKSISEDNTVLNKYYDEIRAARKKIYSINEPISHRFVVKKIEKQWSNEKNVIIKVAPVLVQEGSDKPQKVDIILKNLSAKKQIINLELPNKIQAAKINFILKPFENKNLTLEAHLKTEDFAPLLKISYKPEDDSFPLIKERITLRIKPSIKIYRKGNPGKSKIINLDASRLPIQCKTTWTGEKDLQARADLSWDDKNFYIKIIVNDQFHINRFYGKSVHKDDNIQLAFYFPNRKTARYFEYGLTLTNKGPEVFNWRGVKRGISSNVRLKVERKAGKTIYDAAFPWSELSVHKANDRMRFAFSFGVNDRDSDESWKYIPWTEGIWYGKNPNNFGIIELIDKNISKY